jgi:hypothetical protein
MTQALPLEIEEPREAPREIEEPREAPSLTISTDIANQR